MLKTGSTQFKSHQVNNGKTQPTQSNQFILADIQDSQNQQKSLFRIPCQFGVLRQITQFVQVLKVHPPKQFSYKSNTFYQIIMCFELFKAISQKQKLRLTKMLFYKVCYFSKAHLFTMYFIYGFHFLYTTGNMILQ